MTQPYNRFVPIDSVPESIVKACSQLIKELASANWFSTVKDLLESNVGHFIIGDTEKEGRLIHTAYLEETLRDQNYSRSALIVGILSGIDRDKKILVEYVDKTDKTYFVFEIDIENLNDFNILAYRNP